MADHVELVDGQTALWLKVTFNDPDSVGTIYIDSDTIVAVQQYSGATELSIIRVDNEIGEYQLEAPLSEVMAVLLGEPTD